MPFLQLSLLPHPDCVLGNFYGGGRMVKTLESLLDTDRVSISRQCLNDWRSGYVFKAEVPEVVSNYEGIVL